MAANQISPSLQNHGMLHELRSFSLAFCGFTATFFIAWSAGASETDSLDCLIEPQVVVDLSSPEIGVLGSVRVEEADVVRAGDVVAALHDDVERAALDLSRARAAAHAEIELLQQDHEFNARKRERIERLQDQLAVSTQSADEVRTAEDLARLRLRAATEKQKTIRLEAARDALAVERRTVRSPFDGVIAKKYKSAGEYVEGDPIVQLVQLDPLRVRVIAPIEMFGEIRVGMAATVFPELPIDGPFEASVVSIDPVMDAATATFGVRLSLPNPDNRLPPGLKCRLVLRESPEPAPQKVAQQASPPPALVESEDPTLHESALDDSLLADPSRDQCATLGPIDSGPAADELAAALTARDIGSERRYAGSASVDASWVVLSASGPSPASLLERVRKAGVVDFQLLRRGPWKNRIAFGAYRGQRAAGRRLRQLEALGFDVELGNRDHANAAIWLDLKRPATDPQLLSAVDEVHGAGPTPTVQPIPCTQMASR